MLITSWRTKAETTTDNEQDSLSGWSLDFYSTNYLTSQAFRQTISIISRNFSGLSSRLYLHLEFSASCCEPKGLCASLAPIDGCLPENHHYLTSVQTDRLFKLCSSSFFLQPSPRSRNVFIAFSLSGETTFEVNFLLCLSQSEKFFLLACLYFICEKIYLIISSVESEVLPSINNVWL